LLLGIAAVPHRLIVPRVTERVDVGGGDAVIEDAVVVRREPALAALGRLHEVLRGQRVVRPRLLGEGPAQRDAAPALDEPRVRLTLFAWDDIPATQYGRHTGRFSGSSQLGLLTIGTDEGVQGHAFLGSAMRGAQMDGQSLIHYLKPLVLGQDPFDRERLYQTM